MPELIFTKSGMYVMTPEPISTAYFIKHFRSVCVSVCESSLSLLGRGSVNTLPRQPVHATIEDSFVASFSVRFVSCQSEVDD
jgi:hypothetical protein